MYKKLAVTLGVTALLLGACQTTNDTTETTGEPVTPTEDTSMRDVSASVIYRVKVLSLDSNMLSVEVLSTTSKSTDENAVAMRAGDTFNVPLHDATPMDGGTIDDFEQDKLLDVTLYDNAVMTLSIPPMVSGNSVKSILFVEP